MITLITGQPGAGKTLLAVAEFLRPASQAGRRIVADGVPELAVDHEPAPELATWTKSVPDPSSQDGKKLIFTFPEGALVVIDEAQRIYRPRATGSKVPPEVAAFETHRHQGLDFLILTQSPGLIDPNVRKLVGRHLHIRDLGVFGRKIYEWPEVGNPERFKDAPVQRSYKMHKDAFSLYKSASLHVKPVRGIPKGLLAVALCVPLVGVGVYRVYDSVSSKTKPQPVASGGALPTVGVSSASAAGPAKVVDASSLLGDMQPRLTGHPETAPMYDSLRQVKNMPVVAGCIATARRCRCQTQSGVDAGLDDSQCRAWLENPPFDPYREPVQIASSDAGGSRRAASGGGAPVLPVGGKSDNGGATPSVPVGQSGPV